MTGWNLPPGCTDADIDRAFGGPDPIECPDCGTLNDANEDQCRNCGAHLKEPEPDPDILRDNRIDYERDRDR